MRKTLSHPFSKLFSLIATGISLVLSSSTLFGQFEAVNFQEVESALSDTVDVILKNGNSQNGRISSWDGEYLQLEVTLDAGSASITFQAEEIRAIRFPGDTYLEALRELSQQPDEVVTTLGLYRAFYQQRGPYLQFLGKRQIQLFVNYAQFALQNGKPLRAIAIIEVIRPYIEDQSLLNSMDQAVMLGLFLGGMQKEAADQAREWINQNSVSGASALGWRILAEVQFLEENYEKALWTALNPVAFANQMPMEHLDVCYAFAIAAAQETRQPEVSARLYLDMISRGFQWPGEISSLAGYEPQPEVPAEPEATTETPIVLEEELEPVQTPSPLDPLESLPTRIKQIPETE